MSFANVGQQMSKSTMDGNMSQLAMQLATVMHQIQRETSFIVNLSNALGVTPTAAMAQLGYNNANTDAPGGRSDAAWAEYLLQQMYNLANVYYGTGTQSVASNYDATLQPLTAGAY